MRINTAYIFKNHFRANMIMHSKFYAMLIPSSELRTIVNTTTKGAAPTSWFCTTRASTTPLLFSNFVQLRHIGGCGYNGGGVLKIDLGGGYLRGAVLVRSGGVSDMGVFRKWAWSA